MQDLVYQRPTTIADAVRLASSEGARLLAGGTDLIPQVREGRRTARVAIDLKHIPELTGIARTPDGGWRIGAAASVGVLGRHAEFAREHSGLLASARLIGSLQIQNRATLGGNLCNAAPSGDAVPLMIALDARAEIAGPAGTRTVSVAEIPSGPGRTSLGQGEIVTTIILPAKPPRGAAQYLRFTPRREMDIAVAGSGVALSLGNDGRIASARIVLASVGPTPVVATEAAQTVIGGKPSRALIAAAGAKAAQEARPISDTRGSADYRRELVAVLTRRALEACAADLGITLE